MYLGRLSSPGYGYGYGHSRPVSRNQNSYDRTRYVLFKLCKPRTGLNTRKTTTCYSGVGR